MATRLRNTGEFCWINMLTPQPAQAREFFTDLFGWTYSEIPGLGHSMEVGGRSIGGLFDLNAPNTPSGTPAHIGVMVKVASADAVADRVASLGGKALPPFDIMQEGRMAVCFDPNGANFDLWEPKRGPGTDADCELHGAPSWFEAMTTDVARASRFYAGVFDWTPEVVPMPGVDYVVFKQDTMPVAGMMQIQPQMGPMPPHWNTYFTVTNTDETASAATKLGGTVCVPPMDIAGIGRFCGITSPQGVTFFVIQYVR